MGKEHTGALTVIDQIIKLISKSRKHEILNY
jgi:hypothetical protein